MGQVLSQYIRGNLPYISGEMAIKIIIFFISKSGLFTPGNTLYKQNKGLMMGASLSAVISALLLDSNAKKMAGVIPENTTLSIYADDILMIGALTDIGRTEQTFQVHLPEMPFTKEYETKVGNEFRLHYLEVGLERAKISKTSDFSKISTIWMGKPFHSKALLHFLSYHRTYGKLKVE